MRHRGRAHTITHPERQAGLAAHAVLDHEEDRTMKTDSAPKPDALAPTEAGAALATIPKGMESAFSAEEWAALSPEERQSALAFFKDEANETTRGVQVEFPRIKYPTSGASFFEVPDVSAEGGVAPVKAIEGVIVFKQPVRAYWPLGAEVGNNPPTCSSMDAVTPVASPTQQAPTCAACPHAQWGSGKDQHGQACKSRLNVFMLMNGEEIPTLVSLPPSQLRTFGAYAVALRKANVPGGLVGVTTLIGLTDVKSGSGIAYKGVTLKIGRKLRFPEMLTAKTVRDLFESQMAKRGVKIDEAAGEDTGAGANGHGGEVIDTTGSVVGNDPKAGF